jgi:hypothetical protein
VAARGSEQYRRAIDDLLRVIASELVRRHRAKVQGSIRAGAPEPTSAGAYARGQTMHTPSKPTAA